jgi:hypothetical protein
LPGADINDHLPNRPLPASNHISEDNLLLSELVGLIGLKVEPPDPPPKLPFFA